VKNRLPEAGANDVVLLKPSGGAPGMLVKQAPESGAVEIAAEGTASLADLVQTASQFGIEREVDQIASKAGLTPRASREGLPSAPSGPRVITKHLVRRSGRRS
jgi:hypothetical protein